jgi:tetraacyldisaccharide 4'-kinase
MRILLLPLSFIFRIIVFVRNKLYNLGLIKIYSLDCMVISVGNVSSGGTGKTPMAELIAKYLLDMDKTVCVILKGYKRLHDDMKVAEFRYENTDGNLNTENFGDEALMLLENMREHKSGSGLLIVWDNKVSAAKFADNKFKPDAVIIDDGFQLRKLERDLDVVMVNPYENKHLLPAGNLREPYKNIKRADVVVFNHKFNDSFDLLHKGNLSKAVDCVYKFERLVNINNNDIKPENLKTTAFCGVGDSVSFIKLLEELNIDILDFNAFRDHYYYSENDIENLIKRFRETKADCIITTQKDFVRIRFSNNNTSQFKIKKEKLLSNYPLYYAKIKLQISHNEEYFKEKLNELIRKMA